MASKKNKKKKAKEDKKAIAKKLKKSSPAIQQKLDMKKLGVALLIVIITAVAFSSSINNEFVNWDDDKNFLENENVSTINKENFWENSAKIFKSDVIGAYNPLTVFTFAVEKRMFGFDKPHRWHLNNLLLHLLCTFFVFLIGMRLKLGYVGACTLALLFGIHPMRVESVAWVTERKDVLYGLFYLIAVYYYIKTKQEGPKKKWVLIIAISFIISLLSKIQAVLLPITLILIDYYLSKDSKITVKSIVSKWPFFIGSLVIGITNIILLSQYGSIGEQEYEGISRIFIGGYQLTIYYIKSLIPFRLSPLYPYPASLPWYIYASVLSFVITGILLWFSYQKKWKTWFFGIGVFFSNVFLLLQIFGAGQGYLADRFTYIAYLGLFFIMAYYVDRFYNEKKSIHKPLIGVVTILFIAYGYMTFNQNKIWKNSDTLWTHVLKYYKKSTLPYGNRANYRRDYSQELAKKANALAKTNPQQANQLKAQSNQYVSLALADYESVIKLEKTKANPYNSRARLYFNFTERDSLVKALENYNMAIKLDPQNVEYRVNRGATYAKLGDLQNALNELNEAEKIDKTWGNIYLNRSVIYNSTGNVQGALADITTYLSYNPYKSGDMWYEKGRLHNSLGQSKPALDAINRALTLNVNPLYYVERARANGRLNNIPAAQSDIANAEKYGYAINSDLRSQLLNPQQ
jgi:tetratricopeptide (TPR) repeat protein